MVLLPLALYLDADDADPGPDAVAPPLGRFLGRLTAPVFVSVRESWPNLDRLSVVLDVRPPTPSERMALWKGLLGDHADNGTAESLSGQFALDAATIRSIGRSTRDPDQVRRLCRVRTRPRMDALAQRLQPRVGWDDLVLPPAQLETLHEIANQVAHRTTVYDDWGFGRRVSRGLGISALFAGGSGHGKTLTGEVLAHHLDLDLYRVDLSAVVSKYIGETEKNLRRLFDAAETGGMILFFDEADALFGKRTEVKDSHDRYANIEVSYLLQRMEAYGGLSILATNMRNSLDGAFMRRLRFVVEFPFPGLEERREIWSKVFPDEAPYRELDLDRLAALRVTGGMARNIALNAAFLASAAGEDITMPTVLLAARSEFRKLQHPVREIDFA
jgi:SpoVK/Ycf46/Vps4 family AAA+-type ATPase